MGPFPRPQCPLGSSALRQLLDAVPVSSSPTTNILTPPPQSVAGWADGWIQGGVHEWGRAATFLIWFPWGETGIPEPGTVTQQASPGPQAAAHASSQPPCSPALVPGHTSTFTVSLLRFNVSVSSCNLSLAWAEPQTAGLRRHPRGFPAGAEQGGASSGPSRHIEAVPGLLVLTSLRPETQRQLSHPTGDQSF